MLALSIKLACQFNQSLDTGSVMIERLQVVAGFLAYFRYLFVVLGLFFLALFLLSLFETRWLAGDGMLIPSIIGFCWVTTLYSFATLFANVPAKPVAPVGIRVRFSIWLRRSGLWLIAVLMLSLSLAVLVLSFELLRTWSMP